MSLGRLWSEGVLFGPHASALVADPSPPVRGAPPGPLRGPGAWDVEETASLEEASVSDPAVVRAAFLAGAECSVVPTGPLAVRSEGLPAALSGEIFADPGIAGSLAQELVRTGVEEAVGELSAGAGHPVTVGRRAHEQEIGEKVDVSALTVQSHLARIARQLGTGDRARMVAPGIRSGITH